MTVIPQRILPILRTGLVLAALAPCSAATAQQTPADREDADRAYAQCMRDNGYAEFPDPMPDGGFQFLINPESAPRFQAAATACQQLAPEGLDGEGIAAEDLETLVNFAACMRENGVPDFPDPDSRGGFDPGGISIGPDDARFEAAMAACDDAGLVQGGQIHIGG